MKFIIALFVALFALIASVNAAECEWKRCYGQNTNDFNDRVKTAVCCKKHGNFKNDRWCAVENGWGGKFDDCCNGASNTKTEGGYWTCDHVDG
ncbi:hypothetical protein BGX28_005421 [Mortierella sp. GBA30]|nr:hypothetical protein BGX28_005421 [Mortierella sp. GBA30]